MEDMIYFARTQKVPVASIVPDAAFPANFAQKGTMNGEIALELGEQIAAFAGGGAVNMVPPSAAALLNLDAQAVEGALRAAGLLDDGRILVEAEGNKARVCAQGVAAHAARPESGESAFMLLARALAKSGLLRGQSQAAMLALARAAGDFYGESAGIACEDAETGKTTMVLGLCRTEGGRAVFSVDCRLSIAADLHKTPENARRALGELGFEILSLTAKKPFYLPADDARVQALMRAYRELTGRDDPPYASGGGTYSRYLKNAITFGPGFPERSPAPEDLPKGHGGAHAPDECVYLPDYFEAMYVIAASLLELDAAVD